MIAALYVAKGGPYFNLEGVKAYDEDEDARIYQGPWPVVAHPPCQRYGRFWKGQPGNIAKGKVERKGDDQGSFAWCPPCVVLGVGRAGVESRVG